VDVLLDTAADVRVKIGDRVRGGSSVLAVLPAKRPSDATTVVGIAVAERMR
jgi:hypothetical protein